MNNTVTYRITIQPWQISRICTVNLSRATYNKHGRQLWEIIRQYEVQPEHLDESLDDVIDQVLRLERVWRNNLTRGPLTRRAQLSDPTDTLGGDGGQQGDGSGDLASTGDQSNA